MPAVLLSSSVTICPIVRSSSQNVSPPWGRGISTGSTADSSDAIKMDFWFLDENQRDVDMTGKRGNFSPHFLSAKEYLETDARTRSPATFAFPTPGRASSIKSLGVNLSFPALKLNSLNVDMGSGAGGDDKKGSWATNPKSVTRGSHMSG
jgi:hypothetical protein